MGGKRNWEPLSRSILEEIDRLEQTRRRRLLAYLGGLFLFFSLGLGWIFFATPTPEYHVPDYEHHFQDGSTFVLFIREDEFPPDSSLERQNEQNGD